MVRYKVKFDEEGRQCPTDIQQLKRNPECGIYFIEDIPFNPHNKPPIPNPFSKIDKNLTIDAFGNYIPKGRGLDPPIIPRFNGDSQPIILKQDPFLPELPQDETNELLQGKKGVLELLEHRRRGLGFQAVPVNNELSTDVVDLDAIQFTNVEQDNLLTSTVEELGALIEEGTGTELTELRPRQQGEIIQTRLPPPEPPPSPPGEAGPSRDIEPEELREIQMENMRARQTRQAKKTNTGILSRTLPDLEEIVVLTPARERELILRASKRFTGKDKPKLSFTDVQKILNKLVPKLVKPKTVFDVLNQNNLYDATYENEMMKITAEDRQFLRILQKQNVKMAREKAQGIELQDTRTNLVPQEATAQVESQVEPLEIEQSTGLIDRPVTGFEAKRASKLPEQFSSLVRDAIPQSVDTTTTFDEEFLSETQQLDFGDFQQVEIIGERPTLKFGGIKAPTATELGVGGTGLGVGLGAGFATAKLLENIGVKNSAIIGATTGSAAGGATALTTYALERAAGRAATGVGRGVALGIAEGGVLGLATVPADMFLNKKFLEAGMSHTSANLLSTTATAGTLTALIIGAGFATAFETGGASLVLAAGALAVSEFLAWWSGKAEDKKEQDRLDEIKKVQTTNIYRTRLLQSLEKYDYDYTTAIKNFKDKDKLGMDDA
jgi:hypothetical protein